MIKATTLAFPTYPMSCFKYPKKWYQDVNGLLARFWWGQYGEDKKITWKRWSQLTKARELGGMGFKDLYTFNTALLCKTARKILNG